MEINAENLKEMTEKYIELEDNGASDEELGQLAHEIDHEVYRNELYFILNKVEDETEIVALLVGEEEDDESFFLPVYTSRKEADKAIEYFSQEEGSGEFELESAKGSDIIETYSEEDDFLGLAINAPDNGFVVFAETVHDCSEMEDAE